MSSHREMLADAGLRPTKQRLEIAAWLFGGEDKHFTAETLHTEMKALNSCVSLATVYNTLSAFTECGLLRTVNVEAGRVYYDTNTQPHFHIYEETGGALRDISTEQVQIAALPDLPEGHVVEQIDIIIRTRPAGDGG